MKKLFSILLFLSFFAAVSQTMPVYLDTGTFWRGNSYQGTQGGMTYYSDYKKVISGDTLIDGTAYKKLKTLSNNTYNFPPYSSSGIYENEYIREDSTHLYYRTDWMTHDTLLYDFNLHLGDTLQDTYLIDNNYQKVWVSSVDSVWNQNMYFNSQFGWGQGGFMKIWTLSQLINFQLDSGFCKIYERLGATTGLAIDIGWTSNYNEYGTLFCFSDFMGEVQYQDPWNACTPLILSIDQIASSTTLVNAFPNPANEKLSLRFDVAVSGIIQLFNTTGEIILKRNLDNGFEESFDTSILNNGIYMLRMISSEGKISTKKIIVQH